MNFGKPLRRYSAAAVIALLAATTQAACGQGSDSHETLTVLEPIAGSIVSVPFTLHLSSSVLLGDPATGRHHVHAYFDDQTKNYLLVDSDNSVINKAPAGKHTLHLLLRKADHSSAGAEIQIELTIVPKTNVDPTPSS
ncbi:hypothetical protein [Hamadaea tsunoensis]|uniref:hypothetical protein n=1 Tax=Hamadaea tsunoensis TaxID=53368 RepID=UPI0004865C7F|nr:hypothetical protein [Hamadaea tsunoensis]